MRLKHSKYLHAWTEDFSREVKEELAKIETYRLKMAARNQTLS